MSIYIFLLNHLDTIEDIKDYIKKYIMLMRFIMKILLGH